MFASYAWNDAQTEATLAPETGIPDVAEVAPGKRHSIPSVTDCRSCHDSARTEILGFDALQLSDDRDPNAPHAEPLTRGDDHAAHADRGKPDHAEAARAGDAPPRIEAASPQARAALGYLSTNCGSCHNRESSIASLGLILKHTVRAAVEPDLGPASVPSALPRSPPPSANAGTGWFRKRRRRRASSIPASPNRAR